MSAVPPRDHSTDSGLRQVVRSPDQVALHLAVAGPASRMLAYAVDLALLWSALIALLLALFTATPWAEQLLGAVGDWLEQAGGDDPAEVAPNRLVFLALAFLVLLTAAAEMAWFVSWELVTGGRSPGKALVGLRVLGDGGRPLEPRASLLRNLMRAVDVLPANYLVGLTAMLLSDDGKRLGDLVAGTVVVRLDRPQPAAPLAPARPEPAGFRFSRDQVARIGPPERALARQTLRRLDHLSPERAAEALERATEVLRRRIGHDGEVSPAERAVFLRALLEAGRRR